MRGGGGGGERKKKSEKDQLTGQYQRVLLFFSFSELLFFKYYSPEQKVELVK